MVVGFECIRFQLQHKILFIFYYFYYSPPHTQPTP